MGSHERSSSKWPSIGDAIHVVAAGMHIVMVVADDFGYVCLDKGKRS